MSHPVEEELKHVESEKTERAKLTKIDLWLVVIVLHLLSLPVRRDKLSRAF
jgi:hypothetical protein